MSVIFIAGIDTNIGKSFVTGLLAAYLKAHGRKVTTAKLVQTGCQGVSEDILLHRRLMQEPLTSADEQGLTCPYVFPLAASPHLAARAAGRTIDMAHLLGTFSTLQQTFDVVLVEGAGGLRVPLGPHLTILDLISRAQWPCILTTSSRLGSINHTWLSVEAMQQSGLKLLGLAYNLDPHAAEIIATDTQVLFQKQWPDLPLVPIPWIDAFLPSFLPDFSPWLA